MITIRKLRSLKPGTLRRKTAVILQSYEEALLQGGSVDRRYLADMLAVVAEVFGAAERIPESANRLGERAAELEPEALLREINSLRHIILTELGAEPADWDMAAAKSPVGRAASVTAAGAGFRDGRFSGVSVYLDDLRSPFNIGSIFRTAEAFGAAEIILSPDCPRPDHPRAMRSAMGCTGLVDWRTAERAELRGRQDVFALELGGTPIDEFEFPKQGIAVIGSEELGISPEARRAAESGPGLVSIPVYGNKGSINVSAAFAVMMQRWSEYLIKNHQ